MKKIVAATLATALSIACTSCISRLFSEGMGSTRGASGKVVDNGKPLDLAQYRSMDIESISVAQGLVAPDGMSNMIRADLVKVANRRGLSGGREPALRLSGEIVHYEKGSRVDTVIGPLEEVILRTKLTDVGTGNVVAETNLIGRSKASSSSGRTNLSAGVGKALDEWLSNGGPREAGNQETH